MLEALTVASGKFGEKQPPAPGDCQHRRLQFPRRQLSSSMKKVAEGRPAVRRHVAVRCAARAIDRDSRGSASTPSARRAAGSASARSSHRVWTRCCPRSRTASPRRTVTFARPTRRHESGPMDTTRGAQDSADALDAVNRPPAAEDGRRGLTAGGCYSFRRGVTCAGRRALFICRARGGSRKTAASRP